MGGWFYIERNLFFKRRRFIFIYIKNVFFIHKKDLISMLIDFNHFVVGSHRSNLSLGSPYFKERLVANPIMAIANHVEVHIGRAFLGYYNQGKHS